MLKKRYLVCAIAFTALTMGHQAGAADECGDISIASMEWASAEVIAEIDKLILSAGYGCTVKLLQGATIPTFATPIEDGRPDLTPELWVDAVREPLDAALATGEMIIAAEVLIDGGEEGWWIPKYIAEAYPEIKTPRDALAHPELFPAPDDDSKGAVYNCPAGWSCQITTDNLFKAYGAKEKGFELVDTGSAAGLDGSIAEAHELKQGWLGYYWAPAAMLGRYEMVKLDMGEHDEEQWISCTAVADCNDPQVNGWAKREVFSVITREFAEKAPVAMDYVSKRQWHNGIVNKVLAWMVENQATGEEAAVYFLENYEDIWSGWVSTEVMDKVKAAL